MVYSNLDAFFKAHCAPIVIDEKWVKRLEDMVYGFINRNEEHIHFFGGIMTGVHKMRFVPSDANALFFDMMGMDDPSEAKKELVKQPSFNPTWIVSSDLFNISIIWLSHLIMKSLLKDNVKEQALTNIYLYLHFKLLGSMLHRFFPYAVDPDLAKATYDALSMKFSLKKHGSWFKSLEARCKDIHAKESIRYKTIKVFEPNREVIVMINDIENRLRIRIRRIHATMRVVLDNDRKNQTLSGSIQLDGEMVIKDLIRLPTQYKNYLEKIVLSDREFIKSELVIVVHSEFPMTQQMAIVDVLKYFVHMSSNRGNAKKEVKEYIEDMITHIFEQMRINPQLAKALDDPEYFITKMKNIYSAAKTSDEQVLKLREIAAKVVSKAVSIKTEATLAALRNALMIYIVLRTFSKKTYE